MLKVARTAFAVACFWGLSDIHECSGHLQMAPYPLDKKTVGYNSPQDWLMNLAMDQLLCVICGGENGTIGCHLAGFSEVITFAGHFVATQLPSTLPTYRSTTGIGYASKILSKMAGNSTSYAPNSWWIDRLQIAIESWQISYKLLFPFPSYNTSNN